MRFETYFFSIKWCRVANNEITYKILNDKRGRHFKLIHIFVCFLGKQVSVTAWFQSFLPLLKSTVERHFEFTQSLRYATWAVSMGLIWGINYWSLRFVFLIKGVIRIVQHQSSIFCGCLQNSSVSLNASNVNCSESNNKSCFTIHLLLFQYSCSAWFFHSSCQFIIERKRSSQTTGITSQIISNGANVIWELAGRRLSFSCVLRQQSLILLSTGSILETEV